MNTNVGNENASTVKTERRATHELRKEIHGLDVKKVLRDAKSLGGRVEGQFKERPYVVLAATAGVSFLAGSIFGTRLGRLALAVGAGYLGTRLAEQIDLKSIAKSVTS